MPHGSAPINREQYAVAQQLIHDGAWRVDLETGRIWSNRQQDWIGTIRKGSGYVYLATPAGTGKQLHVAAHRVIWEYVYGPVPDHLEINHKNGVKHDNRLTNLELTTSSGNVSHAYDLGLKTPTAGVTNGMAKLTDDDVRQIRELCVGQVGQAKIARRFGITPAAVSGIKRGKSWAHVPGGELAVAAAPKGKLSSQQTSEVIALLARGLTQKAIAARFGIAQGAVSWIKANKGGA